MTAYKEQFPEGCVVRIRDAATLRAFMRDWKLHNRLQQEQLGFASRTAKVKKVTFYHGGDVLYELEGIPGIWHEQCLENVK